MARATNIYLIHRGVILLACFTVKREAYEWVEASPHDFENLNLSRTRDGLGKWGADHKEITPMEW